MRGIRTDYDIPGRDAEGPGWGRRVVGVTGLSALPGGLLDKQIFKYQKLILIAVRFRYKKVNEEIQNF